ncbi:ARM repeat-containing protein [Exidia glandulosa HHB12029]|uniref:ARM repeat-containing protein n=2 Tax=Exidia glandulosa HHB12029 TaxID=1314781 RepID=A0A165KUC3_EXIGL|nr:ARM repeat-containing protein [Exidia glandulosa HHB12029]
MVNTRGAPTGKRRLQFKEKLVGKGHSADALLAKLKTLQGELARLDQDDVDVGSLNGVRSELVSPSVTLHKDKGVKAYAACCLSDILKLYAPDAPYLHNELKDIFEFFFTTLEKGLTGTNVPYYEQYFYLLDSLAKCKSVVLVCDLPKADELMHRAFRVFFSLARKDLVKNIEMAMSEILCALVDECSSIPQDVLDLIMAQFDSQDAGFRLAAAVCNSRADKLQRYVCAYFTDAIVAASAEDAEGGAEELKRVHALVRRLNADAPGLLHSVVPQLEEQLRVDNTALRAMATATLGRMFADKNGADLARLHAHTWKFWTSRKMDKAPAVRVELVNAAPKVLTAHPELRKEAAEILVLKLEDPDERVRAAVCKAYAGLDFESALHHVEVEHLRKLAERGKDKKPAVREQAFAALGKLYRLALPEIEKNNVPAINHFAWIPEQILHLLLGSQETRLSAEHALAEYILPLPTKGEDEAAWTERLLLVMRFMDDDAATTLVAISNVKLARPSMYDRFVDCCVEFNGGTMDANEQAIKRRLAAIIGRIAPAYFDRSTAAEDLNAFALANEPRLYALLRKCSDPTTDLKTLSRSLAEFAKRVEQSTPLAGAKETILRLVRLVSLWVVNTSSVPTLLAKFSAGGPGGSPMKAGGREAAAQESAKTLFRALCKWCPGALKAHSAELNKALLDGKNVLLTEMALQALAGLAVMDQALVPTDKKVIDRLTKYALGTHVRHAKFAARILAKLGGGQAGKCEQVVKSIANGLAKADMGLAVAHIAALAQFAKFAPDAFEAHSEPIIEYVVQEVLMVPCPRDDDEMDVDDEWVEDKDLPDLAHAKLLALKMCRNRSLARAGAEGAMDVTQPVLKMLFSILENNGSIKEDAEDSGKVKPRMRFRAAVCLLQLGTVQAYATEIVQQFPLLAMTVQDACYTIRIGFVTKYIQLAAKLESRFNLIPFLTAQDPEHDVRDKARQFVQITADRLPADKRMLNFELIFIRFLHLLAHHPDFTSHELEVLQDMQKYIAFYVDTICNAENVALLYHLASRAKTIRDAESHAGSENLYILSEMAQEIIKGRAGFHGWSINNYPGKVKLPSDIFKALPTIEAANTILKTSYLPDEMQTWLEEHNKPSRSPVAKARVQKTSRKRKAGGHGSPAKRTRTANGARRKQDKWSGTEDGEDSESSIEDSDEEEEARASPTPVARRGTARTRAKQKKDEGDEEPQVEDGDKTLSGDDIEVKSDSDEAEETLGRGARARGKGRQQRQKKPARNGKK